jgi:cytochrome c oxidase subunit III
MKNSPRIAGDLADLPTYGFGTRSLTWWGVLGFVAIEGIAFVLAIGAYFFLLNHEQRWPPEPFASPPLLFSTLFTVLLLLSEIPNTWAKKMAEAERIDAVRIGLVIMSVVGALLIALRGYEFHALNVLWNQNAYGSIVWALLFMHTLHLITDYVDTLVLMALMFTEHGKEGRRFVDCSENAFYWRFVVIAWLPIYALIYGVPRWL